MLYFDMSEIRVEYDFTKTADIERFRREHIEANEDAWLAQVKKMESDHTAITIEDTKRYAQLEKAQEALDRIDKKLGTKS